MPKTQLGSKTPGYEFYYFGLNTRGDACRMLLAHAGVTYADKRVKGPEWGAMKATTPTGGLPVLKLKDGT
jgi:glutathione S-transferase